MTDRGWFYEFPRDTMVEAFEYYARIGVPTSMATIAQAFRTLAWPMRTMAHAMTRLGDTLYAEACRAYRQEHRCLPGSERTARLRKKRRDRVMRWWLG